MPYRGYVYPVLSFGLSVDLGGIPVVVDACVVSTCIWVSSLTLVFFSTIGVLFTVASTPHITPRGVNGGSTYI